MVEDVVQEDDRSEASSYERGATALEYGLMISLVAGVVAVALGPLGVAVAGLFDGAIDALTL